MDQRINIFAFTFSGTPSISNGKAITVTPSVVQNSTVFKYQWMNDTSSVAPPNKTIELMLLEYAVDANALAEGATTRPLRGVQANPVNIHGVRYLKVF